MDVLSPVHLPVGVLHNYLLIIASLTELITVNSLGMTLEPAQLFAAQPIVMQTKKYHSKIDRYSLAEWWFHHSSLQQGLTQLNQSICTESRSG